MKREELLATLDVGATVKRLREIKGLSQEELAKGICDRTNITKLENGHSKLPSLSFVLLICDRLEVTIEEFLNCALNNSYSLDRKRILSALINKDINTLEKYISNINFEFLSTTDKRYYTFLQGWIFFNKGELAKGKEYLLPLISNIDDVNQNYISLLAYHELIKYKCVRKNNNYNIYTMEFIQKLMNQKSRKECLYFINDVLETSIKENNPYYSKMLLEKEIQFINSHDCYKFLPIYYKNKIRIFSNNEKLISEIENKLLVIHNNKNRA